MRRIAIILTVLFMTLAAWAGRVVHLTILHTNDMHGMLLPHTYHGTEQGGVARRAALIAQVRRETANPLVLVDAGDVFTRGPWHTKFFGVPEIEAMNAMGYDMLCIGNNEFKATEQIDAQDKMLALLRRSRFPWLAANLTVGDTGQPVPGVQPFIVRDFDGVRVGFIGMTAPRVQAYPQAAGWTISDPIAAAKQWVPRARQECDILIAVTHIGLQPAYNLYLDRDLAVQVPGIDAIVGGDTHTFLEAPFIAETPDGRQVPIFQAGELGVVLGRADLTFTETATGWRLTAYTGKLIPIENTLPERPEIKQLLERWLEDKPAVLDPAA